jgi:hypothetical protein
MAHPNQQKHTLLWRSKNKEKYDAMNLRYVKKAREKKKYYDYERMATIFRKMKL